MTSPVGHAERLRDFQCNRPFREHGTFEEWEALRESAGAGAAALDERDAMAATIKRIWAALGITEYDNGPEISERVVTLRAGRDKANALLDEWIEAQFFGLKSNDLRARTRAFLKSDEKPMPTPEAAELATLRARLTQMEAALACSCQIDAHDFACPTHGGDVCESCGGGGFTFDAEGIEHNCYSCETTGKSMGAPMGKPIAERHTAPAPARPTAEQIALVELMREQLNDDASTLEFQVAQCGEDTGLLDQSFGMRRDADALFALLTAVTGKDTTP